jgi:hypothetical protein
VRGCSVDHFECVKFFHKHDLSSCCTTLADCGITKVDGGSILLNLRIHCQDSMVSKTISQCGLHFGLKYPRSVSFI